MSHADDVKREIRVYTSRSLANQKECQHRAWDKATYIHTCDIDIAVAEWICILNIGIIAASPEVLSPIGPTEFKFILVQIARTIIKSYSCTIKLISPWRRICASVTWVSIGSCNGLSPVRREAII